MIARQNVTLEFETIALPSGEPKPLVFLTGFQTLSWMKVFDFCPPVEVKPKSSADKAEEAIRQFWADTKYVTAPGHQERAHFIDAIRKALEES